MYIIIYIHIHIYIYIQIPTAPRGCDDIATHELEQYEQIRRDTSQSDVASPHTIMSCDVLGETKSTA